MLFMAPFHIILSNKTMYTFFVMVDPFSIPNAYSWKSFVFVSNHRFWFFQLIWHILNVGWKNEFLDLFMIIDLYDLYQNSKLYFYLALVQCCFVYSMPNSNIGNYKKRRKSIKIRILRGEGSIMCSPLYIC